MRRIIPNRYSVHQDKAATTATQRSPGCTSAACGDLAASSPTCSSLFLAVRSGAVSARTPSHHFSRVRPFTVLILAFMPLVVLLLRDFLGKLHCRTLPPLRRVAKPRALPLLSLNLRAQLSDRTCLRSSVLVPALRKPLRDLAFGERVCGGRKLFAWPSNPSLQRTRFARR